MGIAGIDRYLGKLMFVYLIALPTVFFAVISYLYHRNRAYAVITGTTTLVFAMIVFMMVAIGYAF